MPDRLFCNDWILKEVAQELGLNVSVVKSIIDSQSEYTKIIIESNTFDFVRWPYLGVFKSKPKEIQILQYLQGMTPEQASQFKKDVRTGRIRLEPWKDKPKEDGREL